MFLFTVPLSDLMSWNEYKLADGNKFFPHRVSVPKGLSSQMHSKLSGILIFKDMILEGALNNIVKQFTLSDSTPNSDSQD